MNEKSFFNTQLLYPADIIMDTNEKTQNPDIYEGLKKKGLTIALKNIGTGDYILLSEPPKKPLIIERKTVHDLINSIKDSRIWEQATKLKNYTQQTNGIPVIVLEGNLVSTLKQRKISEAALLRVIDTIALDYDIKIILTPNKQATINWLASKAKSLGEPKGKTRISVPHAKKPDTIDEKIIKTMAILLGKETALKLLEKYGNIKTIANLTINELKQNPGIGEKRAREIYLLFNKTPAISE